MYSWQLLTPGPSHLLGSFQGVCLVTKSYPTLCNPMDCSLPGSSVHEISQARILEWVAISYSRDLLNPGIEPKSLASPALADSFFTTGATREAQSSCKQSCKYNLTSSVVNFRTNKCMTCSIGDDEKEHLKVCVIEQPDN